MKVSVIVPSLNPSEHLNQVVEGLLEKGFEDIILINDGSDEAHLKPFEEAAKKNEVTVLTHEVNRGKGAAMKTAYEFCLKNRADFDGVITVDGDNQHLPKDVLSCTEKMLANKGALILGCRDFTLPNVPWKSRNGNNITKNVFRIFCGIKCSDTQTGLRAFSNDLLPFMISISGERYEYETKVLLECHRKKIPFIEVPIETVYIDDNSESHFHPFRDSFKIYKVILADLFKYTIVSLVSFAVDASLFTIFNHFLTGLVAASSKIFIATYGARLFSSLLNYFLNKTKVFDSKAKASKTLLRYYLLCIIQAAVSAGLVHLFSSLFLAGTGLTTVIKVIVDILLYFISFRIQKSFVFRE